MNEPRTNTRKNWPYWLIAFIVLLSVIVFINKKDTGQRITEGAASDSTTVESEINSNWSGIDPNVPLSNYEELKDSELQVRAEKDYAVYSLNETVLFEPGRYVIGQTGAAKLAKVAASVKKRFLSSSVMIYGSADSIGTADEDKKLAMDRVVAVKIWLINYGGIPANQINVNSKGESRPVFANSTEGERMHNRKIDILVRKK